MIEPSQRPIGSGILLDAFRTRAPKPKERRRMKACTVCGAIALAGSNRCPRHPRQALGRPHRRAAAMAMTATTCWRCGKPGTTADPLERDHVQPVILGGLSEPGNYAAAHRSCNRRAGAAHVNGGAP